MRLILVPTITTLLACNNAKTDDVEALRAQIDGLTAALAAAEDDITALQAQVTGLSEVDVVDLESRLVSAESSVALLGATTADHTTQITQLTDDLALTDTTVSGLQSDAQLLASYLFVDTVNQAVVVSGANLVVRSGSGSTNDTNGLGNLIIGYNENGGLDRTGSHNLVLGSFNGYESYGSIVGGQQNAVTAPFSVVLTGNLNTATNTYAVVNTGEFVEASGILSWVGTCFDCDVTGRRSAVVTGEFNASGAQSSAVLGGYGNTAAGNWGAIVGGFSNGTDASSQLVTVLGGENNFATGVVAVVAGGRNNTASGSYAVALGGNGTSASGVDQVTP